MRAYDEAITLEVGTIVAWIWWWTAGLVGRVNEWDGEEGEEEEDDDDERSERPHCLELVVWIGAVRKVVVR